MKLTRWSAICAVFLAAGSLTACNPAQTARKAKDDVDSGNAAACVQERSTIEKAVQAYMLLNPDVPVTETAIVDAGILHQASVLMDVAVDGAVFPAPNTVCA
jgi:predicted small secreted protein